MAADGRWWCYRSVIGSHGAEPKLPTKAPKLLPGAEAAAKLGRILKGVRPGGADDVSSPTDKGSGGTESAEVAWPGHPRAPLRPRRLTHERDRTFRRRDALEGAGLSGQGRSSEHRRRDRRKPRARRQSAGRSDGAADRRLAAAVLRVDGRPTVPGDLLAGRVRGHGRADVLGNAVAAGPGRPPRSAGRLGRDGRGDRRRARLLHALGRRAVPRFARRSATTRRTSCARSIPAIDARFRTVAAREARARSAASRRAGSARWCSRCATRTCSRRSPATPATCTSSCPRCRTCRRGADACAATAASAVSCDTSRRPRRRARADFTTMMVLAQAGAYSPEPGATTASRCRSTSTTGEIDWTVWQRWKAWDPVEMAATHAEALRQMNLIFLDAGTRDEHNLDSRRAHLRAAAAGARASRASTRNSTTATAAPPTATTSRCPSWRRRSARRPAG